MNASLRWASVPALLAAMLAVAFFAPLPVRPYLDFQVLYHAGMGLSRGIPLYDHPGQVAMIAELAGVQPEQVFVLPFPYPPWVALPAPLLALLPIEVSARLWLELNLVMLMASVWLLTDGWPTGRRLASFPLALTFAPVLGGLLIGQYGFPVLLGLALVTFALQSERPGSLAAGLGLMTFKPHLGLPAAAAVLVTLWLRRGERFPRRALVRTGVAAGVLFALGFLADPAWLLAYPRSLVGYGSTAGVVSCELCAGLPVAISGEAGLRGALWVALALAAAGLGLLALRLRGAQPNPGWLVSAVVCLTLLASPYLLNYDYLLALVPFAWLAGRARTWRAWAWISLAFYLPWLGLGLFGRAGNFALVLANALLAVALWRAGPGSVAVPARVTANQH